MKKKTIPTLSQDTARQMLENIFRACKMPSNTVPLKTLSAYSNYRKERYALQRTAILVVLFLFILLPFLFLSGHVSLAPVQTAENENPLYRIALSSSVPVAQLSAHIDGITQPVYEGEGGTYLVRPEKNGELVVEITFFNRQQAQAHATVTGVDWEMPILKDTRRMGQDVLLYLEDQGSGIRVDGIAVTDHQGGEMQYQYDTENQCLTLLPGKGACYVEVPDHRGNVLHLVLSPQ